MKLPETFKKLACHSIESRGWRCFFELNEVNLILRFFKKYDSELFLSESISSILKYGFIDIDAPLSTNVRAFCRHSVALGMRNALFFKSTEDFFVIQDNYSFEGVYFPNRNIFLYSKGCMDPRSKIESLLRKFKVKEIFYHDYFDSDTKFGGVRVGHNSPYHYYYFKIPALYRTIKIADDLGCPISVLTDPDGDFLSIKDVFGSSISSEFSYNFSDDIKEGGVPKEYDANCFYFIVGFRKNWVNLEVKSKIDYLVMNSGDRRFVDFLKYNDTPNKTCFWFGVTSGKRFWLEEAETYISLIGKLSKKFDALFFIDGWTSSLTKSDDFPGEIKFDKDVEIADRIIDMVKEKYGANALSLVGKSAPEKISICRNVDFFFANHATGSLWVSRVAKIPGVTHISNAARGSAVSQHDHPHSKLIPSHLVRDVENTKDSDPFQISYSIETEDFLQFFETCGV